MSALKIFFRICNILSYPFTNWTNRKNVAITKDIVYDASNPDILKADYYYINQTERKYPVLVNIHGGGFVEGDKKFRKGFSISAAKEGYFVVNINYGLCPDNKFPYFINNVISALKHITDITDQYKLDKDKIILSGDSSGAFIAAVSAAAVSDSNFRTAIGAEECKAKIKALMLFCGLYDLNTVCTEKGVFRKKLNYAEILTSLNKEELEEKGLFNLLTPQNYVTSDFPPSFIAYSTTDLFCNGTSKILIDALKSKNIDHEVFEGRNLEDIHCFHLRPIIKNSAKCLDKGFNFLTKILNN